MTWYEVIPKVELYVHLEGAIPHEALFALIQKYGGDPSIPDVASLKRRFEYKGFPQFIEAWAWKTGNKPRLAVTTGVGSGRSITLQMDLQ